jgi:two-component system, chemotaxis family, CheB/CheR fusion protein
LPVSIRGIELLGEDGSSVHIEVLPLQEPQTRNRCLLVLFEVASQSPAVPRRPADAEPVPAQQRHVEGELVAMQEYLQQTVEELETANEELQSSNEELQSSNEELQSSNEELETSKEELQSTNEELNTVNDELESRMGELSLASDDLFNFMGISTEPVVIVGLDLRIRRFTPSAERLLGLAPGDTGRTVRSLAPFFVDFDLEPPLVEAIDTVTEQRKEALGTDGCWYRVRIKPYKTADQAIRGALLVFAEVETADRHGPISGRSPPKVTH